MLVLFEHLLKGVAIVSPKAKGFTFYIHVHVHVCQATIHALHKQYIRVHVDVYYIPSFGDTSVCCCSVSSLLAPMWRTSILILCVESCVR